MTRGLDRRVLDGVNARSLAGFGWESFAWVRWTGFTDGVLSMGSIPGSRTGDGRFDGETSLGGLLIFFLGGWGRGRGAPGGVLLRGFSQDERAPNSPACVIYYMLNSGGFVATCLQAIAKGGSSILGRPGQTCAMFQVSTARRPVHTLTTAEGLLPSFRHGLNGVVGMIVLCTYGLCCYMLYVYYMLYV